MNENVIENHKWKSQTIQIFIREQIRKKTSDIEKLIIKTSNRKFK